MLAIYILSQRKVEKSQPDTRLLYRKKKKRSRGRFETEHDIARKEALHTKKKTLETGDRQNQATHISSRNGAYFCTDKPQQTTTTISTKSIRTIV